MTPLSREIHVWLDHGSQRNHWNSKEAQLDDRGEEIILRVLVLDFTKPKSIRDIQKLIGMITTLSRFIFQLVEKYLYFKVIKGNEATRKLVKKEAEVGIFQTIEISPFLARLEEDE